MVRFAVLGLLLAAASPAQATEWFYVDSATNGSNVSYIDKDSIATNAAGNRTATMVSVSATPDDEGIQGYRFNLEIDCAGKRARLNGAEAFGPGRVSLWQTRNDGSWNPTTDNTQGATILNFVCTGPGPKARSIGAAEPFATGVAFLAAKGKN